MKIFGISLFTLIIVAIAYWVGTKGLIGGITSKISG